MRHAKGTVAGMWLREEGTVPRACGG